MKQAKLPEITLVIPAKRCAPKMRCGVCVSCLLRARAKHALDSYGTKKPVV